MSRRQRPSQFTSRSLCVGEVHAEERAEGGRGDPRLAIVIRFWVAQVWDMREVGVGV